MFASLSIRDPETFAAAVVAAMLRFPKSAVEMMADPVEGLAAKTDNLTLSAVVGYLKADFSWRLRISNNARLSGGPETCRRLIAIDGRVPPMLDDDKSNIRPTMVDLKARYGDTFGLNAMLDPVPDKTIHMKGSNHD